MINTKKGKVGIEKEMKEQEKILKLREESKLNSEEVGIAPTFPLLNRPLVIHI